MFKNQIPAEFVGKARLFYKRVDASDVEGGCLKKSHANSFTRMARKRQFTKIDAIEFMRHVEESHKRFGQYPYSYVKHTVEKRKFELDEIHMATTALCKDHWGLEEKGIALILSQFKILKPRNAMMSCDSKEINLCNISFHAIGRFFQRCWNPNDDNLVESIWHVLKIIEGNIDDFKDVNEFKIPLPEKVGGYWVGQKSNLQFNEQDMQSALMVRTYVG